VRVFRGVAASFLVPCAVLGLGCDAILGIEDLSSPPTQQQFQCEVPTDCPGAGNACFTRVCNGGVCEVAELGTNQPVSSQIAGDCKLTVCNEDGTTREDADTTDVPNDGRECTDDSCDSTNPVATNKLPGTPCSGGVCDPNGECVECVGPLQCGTDTCVDGVCVSAACMDGVKNGDETAKDCGGSCPRCEDGLGCLADSDCKSQVCKGSNGSKTCQAPACDDGKQNGTETDQDCGGSCDGCEHGKTCKLPTDCQSLYCGCPLADPTCMPKKCQVASCDDGIQDGDELAIDCGPSCLGQCDTGEPCDDGTWCVSGVCEQGTCKPPACDDGVKNGTETAIDCGGLDCPACG